METFSALLYICAGNSPPRPNKRLSKPTKTEYLLVDKTMLLQKGHCGFSFLEASGPVQKTLWSYQNLIYVVVIYLSWLKPEHSRGLIG